MVKQNCILPVFLQAFYEWRSTCVSSKSLLSSSARAVASTMVVALSKTVESIQLVVDISGYVVAISGELDLRGASLVHCVSLGAESCSGRRGQDSSDADQLLACWQVDAFLWTLSDGCDDIIVFQKNKH